MAWWWLSSREGHGMVGLSTESGAAADMGDVGGQLRGVGVQPGDNSCSAVRPVVRTGVSLPKPC